MRYSQFALSSTSAGGDGHTHIASRYCQAGHSPTKHKHHRRFAPITGRPRSAYPLRTVGTRDRGSSRRSAKRISACFKLAEHIPKTNNKLVNKHEACRRNLTRLSVSLCAHRNGPLTEHVHLGCHVCPRRGFQRSPVFLCRKYRPFREKIAQDFRSLLAVGFRRHVDVLLANLGRTGRSKKLAERFGIGA